MDNPILIFCPQNAWTKVATGVKNGQIWKINYRPNKYLHTYRMTGDPAPSTVTEGVQMFRDTHGEEISSTAKIDVYVMAIGADGEVRVDA